MALLDNEDSAGIAEALKIYKSWKETKPRPVGALEAREGALVVAQFIGQLAR